MNSVKIGRAVAIAQVAPAALTVLLTMVEPAFAYRQQTQVLTDSCSMLNTIKRWLFSAVYTLGAIGLVLIAISAFLGKFKFAHLISLAGGLFIVALADVGISFMTGGTRAGSTCAAT